jgi:hypothetical protein
MQESQRTQGINFHGNYGWQGAKETQRIFETDFDFFLQLIILSSS